MGFESFGVILRGGRHTSKEAIATISTLKHALPDPESELTPGSTCFVVNDGKHAIEIEVMEEPVQVSCRFTLCHPATVDAVFLALVKELMEALDMSVEAGPEVPSDRPREFAAAAFGQLAPILSDCISRERQQWRAAFGNQTLGATTAQVHERIIAPLYQRTVEKAG
jgi:hypothetical protein